MKKTVSLALVFILIATMAIIPVSAAPGNQNYGNVKKISDSDINMGNGERDAAWDYALAIPVNVPAAEGDDTIATGTTWVLWSDTAYYFYTEVNDSTPVSLTLDDWGVGEGEFFNAWETDSVEIFISVEGDEGNLEVTPVGNFDAHCWQFRIDRNGIPSTYQKAGAWTDDFLIGTDLNKDRFEWAVKQDGNKYYIKHKITYLGAPKAGEVGLQIQINDRLEVDNASAPQTRANETAGSWNADEYGFVVLVDEPAMPPPPAVEEPAPVDESAAGGGEENVHVPAPVTDAPVSAPATSDGGIVIFAVMMILSGAIVYGKKARVK